MLKFTPEAKKHAVNNGGVVFLEYFALISGCCVPFQPEPTVRLGKPHNQKKYREETIEGLTVFIPHELPEEQLIIDLNSFMGMKKLVIEGWRYY